MNDDVALKVEEGKIYETLDGTQYGPLVFSSTLQRFTQPGIPLTWDAHGKSYDREERNLCFQV